MYAKFNSIKSVLLILALGLFRFNIKSNSTSLKWTSTIICFVILLQSCTVYHSVNVTFEEAFQSKQRVKVVTNTNEKYKFKRIEQEENQIIGIVSEKSDTALGVDILS